MTQRKNVQQSTMAFATSCRHRRRKRVIRWKSCLWTLFQFNQSLPFSRKFILNWLYHSCTYKNCVKSTLCWVEARSVFTEKAKLLKITRNRIISRSHLHEKIKYILTKISYLLFRTFGISALSAVEYNFLQYPLLTKFNKFQ